MATWIELKKYVKNNYKIAAETPDMLRLDFNLPGNRSQTVFLWLRSLLDGAEEWVMIESPIGGIDGLSLRRVLDGVGEVVCGGVGAAGDFVTFRHSVPLANLDINEFERPLLLVTGTADNLEAQFAGVDRF